MSWNYIDADNQRLRRSNAIKNRWSEKKLTETAQKEAPKKSPATDPYNNTFNYPTSHPAP